MTKEEVLAVIAKEVNKADVAPEMTLEDLAVDSLEFIDLTMRLADVSGKFVPDIEISQIQTVSDMMAAYAE
jgi:acyl carrier protein